MNGQTKITSILSNVPRGGSFARSATDDMTVKSSDTELGIRVERDYNQIIIPAVLCKEVGIKEGESARTSPVVAAVLSLHLSNRPVSVQNIALWLGIKGQSNLLENRLITLKDIT